MTTKAEVCLSISIAINLFLAAFVFDMSILMWTGAGWTWGLILDIKDSLSE